MVYNWNSIEEKLVECTIGDYLNIKENISLPLVIYWYLIEFLETKSLEFHKTFYDLSW